LPLQFIHRVPGNPQRVVLFPGTWNPPTVAHIEIARAALQHSDEVVWVLPRAFPHKNFEGASFEDRLDMLRRLARDTEGFSAAISFGGLYADIAEEAREHFGPSLDLSLVMGRDAAERIAAWDYGRPGAFDDFVSRYKLLVAARSGHYLPAPRHAGRISPLPMGASWDDVSSSEVRRRMAAGEKWRHLVPNSLIEIIENLY
jgi:nicotinate-nucleotide adenylyltransferase